MIKENHLSRDHLVYPMSVDANISTSVPVDFMPGIMRYSIQGAVEKARELCDLGIGAVYLIGIPLSRDEHASDAYAENGVIPKVTREIKRATGDKLMVIGDSYLGYFTNHQIGGVLDDKDRIQDGPTWNLSGKSQSSGLNQEWTFFATLRQWTDAYWPRGRPCPIPVSMKPSL